MVILIIDAERLMVMNLRSRHGQKILCILEGMVRKACAY